MSVKDKLTSLADSLRSKYGTGELLTLDQINNGINGLEIQNLLEDGQSLDTTVDTVSYKALTCCQNFLTIIRGQTITMSCDVSWSGWDLSKGPRAGLEFGFKFKNNPELWAGAWEYPTTTSGSAHVYADYKIYQDTITGYDEGTLAFSNPSIVGSGAVTKITNPKIVINPMGG